MAFDRASSRFRSTLELELLPRAIAALPWRLGHRVARWLARIPALYRAPVAAAVASAARHGWCDDTARFAREQRALRLVDHADLHLSRARGEAVRGAHVRTIGAWPAGDAPILAITVHWGVGLFGIASLAATGRRIACLSTRLDEAHVRHDPVLLRYGRARLAEVERVAGAKLIYAGHGARPFLRAIERGESLLALIDVPPDAVGGAARVRLLDRDAWLPSGLVKLAAKTRLPVVFFAVELDAASGDRIVRIAEPFVVEDRDGAMQRLADGLDACIRRSPPAWTFWPFADAFFAAPRESQ